MKSSLVQFLKIGRKSESSSGTHLDETCRHFSLSEIKAATNNFHEDMKIGKSIFGCYVFKGFINNGTTVAVKRLSKSDGLDMFKQELRVLYQLRHPNLVSLIGFCYEKNEAILVYEYMNNQTLQHHLYGSLKSGREPLSWEQRLKICIAVARALHYLHAGVKYAVIHRDVRSSIILLDENWTAKISGFGLYKIGPSSTLKSSIKIMDTTVAGTIGYLDPQYYRTQELTEKSDVYSFGVVLLEVLCARKVVDKSRDEDEISLTEMAKKCIENESIYSIIDPYLQRRIALESLQTFAEIAYDCLLEEGRDRPSLGEVAVTLEVALELQVASSLSKQYAIE